MPTDLDISVIEKSSCAIEVSFTDSDGVSLTPTVITWSLTDTTGAIINSKQDVSATPAPNIEIVLSGDDLQILATEHRDAVVQRVITIESSYLYGGNTLSLNNSAVFRVKNITYLT